MSNTKDNVPKCEHKNKVYQPREKNTDVLEDYYCDDCGESLPLPEPDFDLIGKEEKLNE